MLNDVESCIRSYPSKFKRNEFCFIVSFENAFFFKKEKKNICFKTCYTVKTNLENITKSRPKTKYDQVEVGLHGFNV